MRPVVFNHTIFHSERFLLKANAPSGIERIGHASVAVDDAVANQKVIVPGVFEWIPGVDGSLRFGINILNGDPFNQRVGCAPNSNVVSGKVF